MADSRIHLTDTEKGFVRLNTKRAALARKMSDSSPITVDMFWPVFSGYDLRDVDLHGHQQQLIHTYDYIVHKFSNEKIIFRLHVNFYFEFDGNAEAYEAFIGMLERDQHDLVTQTDPNDYPRLVRSYYEKINLTTIKEGEMRVVISDPAVPKGPVPRPIHNEGEPCLNYMSWRIDVNDVMPKSQSNDQLAKPVDDTSLVGANTSLSGDGDGDDDDDDTVEFEDLALKAIIALVNGGNPKGAAIYTTEAASEMKRQRRHGLHGASSAEENSSLSMTSGESSPTSSHQGSPPDDVHVRRPVLVAQMEAVANSDSMNATSSVARNQSTTFAGNRRSPGRGSPVTDGHLLKVTSPRA